MRTIEGDGFAALVSDLPGEELRFGREELTTHARVLEKAIERGTVLPMRFGVVMGGEPAVRRDLLDAHHDELRGQRERLEGTVELRLRAVYEEQALMREIVGENPEVARLRGSLRRTSQDASYYGRIQLGELVAAAIERKREQDAAAVIDRLAPLALAVEVGQPAHERAVLSAWFLVERARLEAFDAGVDRIGREQAERMRFKYTGPLPPHSFVELAAGA